MNEKLSRRGFIAALVSAFAGTAATSSTASAEHGADLPDHVSIEFDEPFLKKYQPHYVMSAEAEDLHRATFAWVVRSTEYDTDVCCYWNAFVGQNGVSQYDSHRGDHEPAYCWVNSETGDLEDVSASVYHWLEDNVPASAAPIADETHPVLKVIDPWHHHTAGTPGVGEPTTLEPLGTRDGLEDPETTTEFEAWLNNGLEADLGVGTVTEPWKMRRRTHWWKRNVGSYSTQALQLQAYRAIGWHVAGNLEA